MTPPILMKKSVYERRKWKHFGSVTPENCMDFTVIEPEIHIELVQKNRSYEQEQEMLWHRSFYSQMAEDCKFPQFIVRKIKNSSAPKQDFMKQMKQMSALIDAKVQQKFEAKLQATSATADAKQKENTTKESTNKKPMGLRARMMAKSSEKKDESNNKAPGGIRARMQSKQVEMDTEAGAEHERTLFISNVPVEYTKEDILDELDSLGYEMDIRRVNMVIRDGESIGKAFVVMGTKDEAEALLTIIDGTRWLYCVISAQIALPKENAK